MESFLAGEYFGLSVMAAMVVIPLMILAYRHWQSPYRRAWKTVRTTLLSRAERARVMDAYYHAVPGYEVYAMAKEIDRVVAERRRRS